MNLDGNSARRVKLRMRRADGSLTLMVAFPAQHQHVSTSVFDTKGQGRSSNPANVSFKEEVELID